MLTREVIDGTVDRIALMSFFPSSDPGARSALTKELTLMAESDEQVLWLEHRMIQLYPKGWPGLGEMRALFCNRFDPCDGLKAISSIYEEGYPTEVQLGKVPGILLPPSRSERDEAERQALIAEAKAAGCRLLPGVQSADPEMEAIVERTAEAIAIPPIKPITMEDVYDEIRKREERKNGQA